MKSEFKLIELLKNKIPRKLQGSIGIGDDAGALRLNTGQVLLASDTVVDGVDFISGKIKPELAGRKALAVNLSDIAAMGGEPAAFVVNLGIPKKFSEKWILKFYDGLTALAKEYNLPCLGGDISKSRDFFASVSILGKSGRKMILRGGAKEGDWIGVTGKLGGSILGRHASFEPRVREGSLLAAAGVSAKSPGIFPPLIFFLLGRLPRPRPSAGNANRWAFPRKIVVFFSKPYVIKHSLWFNKINKT